MKVLQIIDSLPATSGGARFVTNLTKKLSEEGVDVELLLIDGNCSHFLDEIRHANIKINILGVNVNRFHPKFIRKVSNYLNKYDLIHVHIFPTSYIVALASLINKNTAPIVFTEHNAFNRRAINPVFKYLENFIYSRFNKAFAITPEVKDFLLDNLDIDDDKIKVIINGVDLDKIISAIPLDRSKIGLSGNDVMILMAARFSKQKDYNTLIKAMVHLPNQFKLIMCGDGEDKNGCEDLVKSLNLSDRAFFLGNRDDIYNVIKCSDINVLSSHYEGFGLSIVEAMAARKPVIASNVEGMSQVVDGAGLLFNVSDDKKLAEHILKLGIDEIYYEEISQKCYQRAQNYSLEVMVNKYISEYKEILNDKYAVNQA
ncbi:glycosyltransferase family 4 protein [Moraxella osloensis]|nr:glycosyltransferase family 4 protein [Moraxella osloensis]UAY37200.1 glycosyltransferase family 4 protein [Moraxella osloensis]